MTNFTRPWLQMMREDYGFKKPLHPGWVQTGPHSYRVPVDQHGTPLAYKEKDEGGERPLNRNSARTRSDKAEKFAREWSELIKKIKKSGTNEEHRLEDGL